MQVSFFLFNGGYGNTCQSKVSIRADTLDIKKGFHFKEPVRMSGESEKLKTFIYAIDINCKIIVHLPTHLSPVWNAQSRIICVGVDMRLWSRFVYTFPFKSFSSSIHKLSIHKFWIISQQRGYRTLCKYNMRPLLTSNKYMNELTCFQA